MAGSIFRRRVEAFLDWVARRGAKPVAVLRLEARLAQGLSALAGREARSVEQVAGELLSQAIERRAAAERLPDRWERLTPRERETARLAALGLSNHQIAERLYVTPGAIKKHLRHARSKLGLASKAELRQALKDLSL